jgi:hypothetical protein
MVLAASVQTQACARDWSQACASDKSLLWKCFTLLLTAPFNVLLSPSTALFTVASGVSGAFLGWVSTQALNGRLARNVLGLRLLHAAQ